MSYIKTEDYLDYLKYQRHYSEETIKNYELDLIKYSNFLNDNEINYKSITYPIVTQYMEILNDLNLKPSSISRNLSTLRGYYDFLVRKKEISTNPFKLISGIKKEKKLPNYLQYSEFEDILLACSDDDLGIRNKTIIELLLATGTRVSELINIKLNDVDEHNHSIKILGKGNKERIVYFGGYALKNLKEYVPNIRNNLLQGKDHEYLFVNHLGDKLTRRGIYDIIDRLLNNTAIEKNVSPHTFRHSFATMMLNEGASIKVVQDLLGHASLSTTSIYTHLSNDKLKSVYLKTHPRARK